MARRTQQDESRDRRALSPKHTNEECGIHNRVLRTCGRREKSQRQGGTR
jgi:hypothetical protein